MATGLSFNNLTYRQDQITSISHMDGKSECRSVCDSKIAVKFGILSILISSKTASEQKN